jgi:hypothetical protein
MARSSGVTVSRRAGAPGRHIASQAAGRGEPEPERKSEDLASTVAKLNVPSGLGGQSRPCTGMPVARSWHPSGPSLRPGVA